MEKNVDELKKKVLELRYTIDKKDGEFPLLRFATIVGIGIIGAAEVVLVLWVLVQLAKGLM